MENRRIAILGSTGSVGRNALLVIEALGRPFEVVALSAHRNVELLGEQVRKHKPKYVCICDETCEKSLREALGDQPVRILTGAGGMVRVAELDDVDFVFTSVVGVAGLGALLAAAKKGKRLAIANKEPLVVAGELLTKIARVSGSMILPVDSEHSAVFQSLQAGNADEVNKIILTASGGPFRDTPVEQMNEATAEQALAHPTWRMGPKITVDSATMMNKALEVIEAHWLFNVPLEKIEVLIHPESIVHSLVEFVDGSVIAQLGTPDMCLPIQYALTFPQRRAGIAKHLKLDELGRLTFEKPDVGKLKALQLGYEAARTGGIAPAVLNAANEAAVEHFLAGRIRFGAIIDLIEHCLKHTEVRHDVTLDTLLAADKWARNEVNECLNQKVR